MERPAPSRLKVWLAFASVYIIWGSTYLTIKYAIESFPPFLMGGARFLIAGLILYGWTAWKGVPAPKAAHWKEACIMGAFLLLIGNGGVVWAEQTVPTGLTSLLIASEPLWILVLEGLVYRKRKVNALVILGALVGFSGVALLVSSRSSSSEMMVNPLGAFVLIFSALSWANGSIYSLEAAQPESPLQGTGMKMIAGGFFLCVAGLAAGEFQKFSLDHVSLRSSLSLLYLIVFGSIVGFSSYIWILKVSTPSRASTYAYVNPVIALALGAVFAGEKLTLRILLAGILILTAVAVITVYQDPEEAGQKT